MGKGRRTAAAVLLQMVNESIAAARGRQSASWLTRSGMDIYSPPMDLMANADLGGKIVLYMLDASVRRAKGLLLQAAISDGSG